MTIDPKQLDDAYKLEWHIYVDKYGEDPANIKQYAGELYLAKAKAPPIEVMNEKWYGYAGHLIVGKRCAYHLCTVIPGYMISTVGHFLPKGLGDPEPIGAGNDAMFETMVFTCDGEDKEGNPNVTEWSCIESERYAKSFDAEQGHYVWLNKYRSIAAAQRQGGA